MFNNIFQNKKVIVTGNTGFKGSWLTSWLLQMGANVTGISIDVPTEPSLFHVLRLEEKIEHHFADIRDLPEMQKIFTSTEPDFVFHLAAQPIVSVSYDDPVATLQTNIMGTAHILESLRTMNKLCIAVMITSDKCYDNVEWIWGYREQDALGGKDPYSASKGGAELVVKTYYHSWFKKPGSNVKLVSVRAGNVIGGGDWAENRIVPDCIRAWSSQKAVSIRHPHSTRPWQHVLEPLSGYLRAAQILEEGKQPCNGEAFNFGPNSEQEHTVLDLLKSISQFWKFDNNSDHFSVDTNHSFHEAGLLKLNCDKALHFLQWRPVLDFEHTSKFAGSWYDEFYHTKQAEMYEYSMQQIKEYEEKAKQKSLSWAL